MFRPNFTSWTPASDNEVGNYCSFGNLKDESLLVKSARREARFLFSWKIFTYATDCSTSPFKLRALVMQGCEHFTQFLSQSDFVKIPMHTREMQSTEELQSREGCTEDRRHSRCMRRRDRPQQRTQLPCLRYVNAQARTLQHLWKLLKKKTYIFQTEQN